MIKKTAKITKVKVKKKKIKNKNKKIIKKNQKNYFLFFLKFKKLYFKK